MAGPLLIWRSYKLKRALKRLQRARENSLRIHYGEKPRYPLLEQCWIWFIQCFRNTFCRTCCPCCLHPKLRNGAHSESFWRRPCQATSFENFLLRSFLGFLGGILLTTFLFFLLRHQLNCSPFITTAVCCVVGFVLTNSMAFSPEARCIVLLALPSLFSNRGRIVLLAYIYILVMSGPAKNALRNANVLVGSMNCGQELLIKQTKALMKAIFSPLVAIVDAMRDILKALKEFARMMKEAFIAIRDLFLEIINAIKIVFEWLMSIVKVCTNKYGSPYQKCNRAFEGAIRDCEYKMGAFKFLCKIVSAVQYVCEIARIVDLLCMLSDAIKVGIIEPLKEHFRNFAKYMYVQFYVNVTFIHYYNYSLEQSKSFREIRGDIQAEIHHRTQWLSSIIDWSNIGTAFFFLILVANAYIYRARYLSADHFDNVYVNFHLKSIDDRRAFLGKETILPLSFRERRHYVHIFSPWMARFERKRLMSSMIMLLISGAQMGISMLLDYSLYEFLRMIRYYGKLEAKAQMPSVVKFQVKGVGVMADMYRQMVTQFDPLMKTVPEFDTTECLPNPLPLDLDRYRLIGMLYGLCFILALTESYGLRLRHIVCSCYYPERERIRAVWLYNRILRTRGGLLKFLRRAIRRKVRGDDTFERISLMDRLVHQYPMLQQLLKSLGYFKEYCVSCGGPGDKDDPEAFKRCISDGCRGIYCHPCYQELNNICTLCMRPVEYGDDSDMSEEVDSSDEDAPQNKQQVGKSDDEDYAYQYEESMKKLDSDKEETPRKRKRRELATVDDISSSGDDMNDDDDEYLV